jgi:RimJ/RimL family protein N-acetyltransferase
MLEGRFARLEPLSASAHGDDLFAAASVPDIEERFRWLADEPPASREAYQPWLAKAEASADPLYWAVIERVSGKAGGRQSLLRTDAANGVTEVGHVYWGPLLSRRPAATEALYLAARHVFDTLGYRRFEWKCNAGNAPSRRAAARFGFTFEGIFRQHQVVKGRNRDTAWFAMLDGDWPRIRAGFEAWLAPENFDAAGNQKRRLEACRTAAA